MSKPKTLAEAVYMLYNALDDEGKKFIREHGTMGLHHGYGTHIRNEYGLWDRKSDLHKFFREHYGLGHADDMSGVILTVLEAKITDADYNIDLVVNKYKNHWIQLGIDPLTQTEI